VVLPHDDVGSGAAVVLLHAGVADRTMWTEHLEHVAAAGYRAVAVDLPGFGEAPVDQHEDAPWRDVLLTMDALGIDRTTLVGNSFGGAVAQRVAVVAPERIVSLVLISSPASGVEPSHELEAFEQAEETALDHGDMEAAVEAVLAAWTLPDAASPLRERVATMQRRAFELQANTEWGPAGFDPLEHDLDALSRVEAPASVTVGEHDVRDFHIAADALVDALPNARKNVLLGAGHLAPLEQPEAFRELLLRVLSDQG
jgi:pimeloyl-ACP methyl ester carboxylesterase